jgi:hypothetical protein
MRVLLAVATYPTEPAVHAQTRASIEALAWEGDLEIWYQRGDDPALTHHQNLVAKHNAARDRVLAEGYDALFSVEADMIIPVDALSRLAMILRDGVADVAYGLYCSRSAFMWLLFETITPQGGTSIAATPVRAAEIWGTVVPSAGVGMGCTLIHRRVLEQVAFRLDEESPFADDWQFAIDVAKGGFRQAHDTAVICGHITTDNQVIWPDVHKDKRGELVLHRVEEIRAQGEAEAPPHLTRRYLVVKSLYSSNANRYIVPGEIVELGNETARLLMQHAAVTPAAPVEVVEAAKTLRGRRKR